MLIWRNAVKINGMTLDLTQNPKEKWSSIQCISWSRDIYIEHIIRHRQYGMSKPVRHCELALGGLKDLRLHRQEFID